MKRLDLRSISLSGRSSAFATLEGAYNRVKDSNCTSSEIAMVQGYSGTGKSSLVKKLQRKLQESDGDDSCYFVSGKFDQQKTTEPYHALAAALNELCDLITASGDKDKTRTSFLDQVGSKGKVLLYVVPKMSQLIGDLDGESLNRRNATALNQLKYVLRAFVRTVSNVTKHPIVIFLDDLQWADVSSLELLESLMLDSESKRILFIGSYRDNDVDQAHPLAVRLCNIEKEKQIQTIELHNLDMESVNGLIANVTELDPSSTQPLTDVVHQKTNGNIFFLLQFLQMLQEEELLYFSTTLYKWSWNIDKIKAQTNLADNVVDLVCSKIQRLQAKTQAALKLAACLWSTFNVELLREVMSRAREKSMARGSVYYEHIMSSDDDLVASLDTAVEEGLLDKLSGSTYKFAHDRIRQAAFSLVPEGRERENFHHWVGGILWEMTESPPCEEWVYFAAADQMNRGAGLIEDERTKVGLAKLNLVVAEKAISLSAFVPALSYLKSGIGHLPSETKWSKHYDVTLRLYNALAEMEHCTGSPDQMQKVVFDILANAKCFEDKIDAFRILGVSLLSQSKQNELMKLCYKLLGELGEPFPKRITKAAVTIESLKLKRLLRGKTDDNLLQLPLMTDERKLNAAKFLDLSLTCFLYTSMMRELSLVTIRLMRMILRHGLCDESALAFVFWGEFLVRDGSLQEGYRFGRLALRLAERFDSKVPKGHVVAYACGFVIHWKEPLQNTLDPFLESHRSSMLSGDITGAFQTIVSYQLSYYASGLPLPPGCEDLIAYSSQMREYRQESNRRFLAPILQMMLNLMGRAEADVLTLTGEIMDQDEFENIESNPHRIGVQAIASCRMQLAYYFGDLHLASELSKKLQSVSEDSVFSASYLVCVRAMFFGLISIDLARKTRKRKHAADALSIISMMEEKWVKNGAINCLHKRLLLKAEYCTIQNNRSDVVRKTFDAAISAARRVGFIQDEALANERAGVFLLERGDQFWASSYLSRARDLYSEWGAQAKCDQLETRHGSLLSKSETQHASSLRGRSRFTDKSSKSHKNLDAHHLYGSVSS